MIVIKLYSERFAIKYLFSSKGVCLGIDTKKASFLFLVSRQGILLRKRPVGDRIVENMDYEIDRIHEGLMGGK
ncbi:MAG: hypothetical protein KIY12_03780 [Thermoplasmata archaeon]|uniref:Uncharacterized protein n=1 Tax=Candidatus Sysuiplasma superficiale TaxID=2823368 RepID=A0A8J8CDF4_9ARCH|nr:hypothetical protein [Candidatus Sysuiplasma superficiale]MBX8643828.1 hypothetical protein [Candidatus Sysuiplasma superficiale]MCL4347273.1 hypothetical protein [Candidatus Thermoplasmatota archaeon]